MLQIFETLTEKDTLSNTLLALVKGVSVIDISSIVLYTGFLEGKWTVDVAKLLEPIVAMMITGEASLANIPAKINLGDAGDTEFYNDMAERKYDMKQNEEMLKKELDMPDMKSVDVKGLMAKLGE